MTEQHETKVSHAARDAAASLIGSHGLSWSGDMIRDGKSDDHAYVQTFARFESKIRAQGRLEGVEAGLEAAAKEAYVPNRVTLNAWRTREAITAAIRNLSAQTIAGQIGEK